MNKAQEEKLIRLMLDTLTQSREEYIAEAKRLLEKANRDLIINSPDFGDILTLEAVLLESMTKALNLGDVAAAARCTTEVISAVYTIAYNRGNRLANLPKFVVAED